MSFQLCISWKSRLERLVEPFNVVDTGLHGSCFFKSDLPQSPCDYNKGYYRCLPLERVSGDLVESRVLRLNRHCDCLGKETVGHAVPLAAQDDAMKLKADYSVRQR